MAIVVADMSMSLDGFVAGPNDEVDQVFSWRGRRGGRVTKPGSRVRGRRGERGGAPGVQRQGLSDRAADVDLAGGWGGTHPVGVPVWIPTHDPPDGWDDAPFSFVTEGVEAAVRQASEHAGDGVVGRPAPA
jgi:hypothetical protein